MGILLLRKIEADIVPPDDSVTLKLLLQKSTSSFMSNLRDADSLIMEQTFPCDSANT